MSLDQAERTVLEPQNPHGRRLSAAAVDMGAVVLLTLLGLWGFRSSFGGLGFLLVGGLGLALGVAIAYFGHKLGEPLPVVLLVGVVFAVLLSGVVALRQTAAAGVLPTSTTLQGLAEGISKGWQELVTTPRPVGDTGYLFAIPYLCGFAAGLLGVSGALRSRRIWWGVLPPALVLAAGILTGTAVPASLLLQGSAFAAVVLVWASVRSAREIDVVVARTSRGPGRVLVAAALVTVAALLGLVLSPVLPGAASTPRLLLHLDPDFDPAQLPSPLVSTRHFLLPKELGDQVLFRVTGDLPAGTPIRLAVLDAWDGTTAGVAGSTASPSSGTYDRVGETIPTTVTGDAHHVTIEIVDNAPVDGVARSYRDVWAPTVGGLTSVNVSGPGADLVRKGFRYNLATDSALVTTGVQPGTTFDYDVLVPSVRTDLESLLDASVPSQPVITAPPPELQQYAADHVGDTTSPYARVKAVIAALTKEGSYAAPDLADSPRPGHGFARLKDFFDTKPPLGDEEQYGAVALLLARQAGVPTRLVMGFRPGSARSGAGSSISTAGTLDVMGGDLTMWLEVRLQGAGWVSVGDSVTPLRSQKPTQKPQQVTLPNTEVQPPPPIAAKVNVPPSTTDTTAGDNGQRTPDSSGGLPGWVIPVALGVGLPLLLVWLVIATILGLKRRRARRRFTSPDPSSAITGGWSELLDRARDHGFQAPPAATRTEAGSVLVASAPATVECLPRLVSQADVAAFAPEPLSQSDVDAYWADVDTATAAMSDHLSWWGRWRARLSLTSLLPSRSPRRHRPSSRGRSAS
jgi:transglutaminase-like putative cysteine protease